MNGQKMVFGNVRGVCELIESLAHIRVANKLCCFKMESHFPKGVTFMLLKQYYDKQVQIVDYAGHIFSGRVADYIYPEDNENGKGKWKGKYHY